MDMHHRGTTNIGIRCKDGVVLGCDSRITTDYKLEGGPAITELASDQEVKLFRLSTKLGIYCTLMGDVEEWHKMYKYLRGLELKSFKEACSCVKKYLEDYRKDRKNKQVFGTVIAGYGVKEGFQMKGFSFTLGMKSVTTHDEPTIVIGSGSKFATQVLNKRADYSTMSEEDAVTITLKALMEGNFGDPDTGGYLKVIFVHKGGCITGRYHVLDVYKKLYDPSDAFEKRALLFIHSTSIGPIFGYENIHALIRDLWSKDLGEIKTYGQCNNIAKKGCFYVTRMVLQKEGDAEKVLAYLSTKNVRPIFPAALAHIRTHLIDCVRGTTGDHFYVGLSSKELVDGICNLEDADTLKYN